LSYGHIRGTVYPAHLTLSSGKILFLKKTSSCLKNPCFWDSMTNSFKAAFPSWKQYQ